MMGCGSGCGSTSPAPLRHEPVMSPGPGVHVTPSAAAHIANALIARGHGQGVRIKLVRAGCSGWSYRLEFAEEVGEGELEFCSQGTKLFVKQSLLPYLDGIVLDYVIQGLEEVLPSKTQAQFPAARVGKACPVSRGQPNKDGAFQVLGLPVSFKVDGRALLEHYRNAMLRCHPDLYLGAPAWVQWEAQAHARRVNAAYACLKDPLRRAAEVLDQNGHRVADFPMPGKEAARLMELNDALEAAVQGGSALEFALELRRNYAQELEELGQALQHGRWLEAIRRHQRGVALRKALGRLGINQVGD